MNKNILSKILFAVSFVCLAGFAITAKVDSIQIIPPLSIAGFICFALGAQMSEKMKPFSFSLWVMAAVSTSLCYPQPFSGIVYNGEMVFSFKLLIVPLLQVIMFGMGSTMSLTDVTDLFKMPKAVCTGVIGHFTIMPILGITIAKVFGFPPEIAAGIILVSVCPCGLASNVMAFIAKANVPLSITVTTVGTLLATVLTPFLMEKFAGALVPVDTLGMMVGVFKMVILPIAAGLTFSLFAKQHSAKQRISQLVAYSLLVGLKSGIAYFAAAKSVAAGEAAPAFNFMQLGIDLFLFVVMPIILVSAFKTLAGGRQEVMDKILSIISMYGIALIIVVITAAGRDSMLSVGFKLLIACFIMNILGYAAGYFLGKLTKLPEQDCRTLAYEIGMHNGGLASGLALGMGKVATVGLAAAVFGPMMNITGSTTAFWWRENPPKDIEPVEDIEGAEATNS